MNITDAIYNRRSIRSFTEETIDKETINKLIDTGIKAPSSMNSQPWRFSVIQDRELLKKISDNTKNYLQKLSETNQYLEKYKSMFQNPEFNIFYNASTLLTIYAKLDTPNPENDCALAAQNIMLMAHSLGLGTCWIGFAQRYLNTEEGKNEFGISDDYKIVAPLIIGYPDKKYNETKRNAPEILFWK